MDRVGGSGTSQPLSKPARNPRGSALRGSAQRDSDPKDRTPKDSAPKDIAPKGRAQALRRTAALSLNSNGIQSNCVSTEIHKVCNAMALFDSPRGPPLAPTGLAHPAAMDPPAPLPRSPSPPPPLPLSHAPALRRQPGSAAPTAQLSSHSAPAHPAATDPQEPLQRRSPSHTTRRLGAGTLGREGLDPSGSVQTASVQAGG